MRRRVAGIEIDFGRLPLLKGEDRGASRTDKSRRSDLTRIRIRGPPEATTPWLDTSKSFQAAVAPGIPGAFTNNRPKRNVDSPLLLAPTRRRDVAPTDIRTLSTSLNPRRRHHTAPRRILRWTCQLFHCVICRVWQCFTTDDRPFLR